MIGSPPTVPYFDIHELPRGYLRAAAQIVAAGVDKNYDRQRVTAYDLKLAEKAMASHKEAVRTGQPENSPFAGRVKASEIAVLEAQLPELKKLLSIEPRNAELPYANSLWVPSIADPKLAECAREVALHFGARRTTDDWHINWGELAAARKSLDDLASGALSETQPDLAKKLRNSRVINKPNLDAICFFMETGNSGFINHGPMQIDDKVFTEVYRLEVPVDDSGRPALPPKAKVTSKKTDKAPPTPSELAINNLELNLDRSNSGFDRIYVKGHDGFTYVALNPKGDLDDVMPNYNANLSGPHATSSDAGRVVRVKDIPNSAWEATVGFWINAFDSAIDTIRGKLFKKLDRKVADAIDNTIDRINNEDPAKIFPPDGKTPWVGRLTAAVVGVASVGASIAYWPVGVGVTALGFGVTVDNVRKYASLRYDDTPFLNAAGVAPGGGGRRVRP